MESLTIGEKLFRLEFKWKVAPEDYDLMIETLKSHTPHFETVLFEIFSLTIKKGEKTKNRILNLFRENPKRGEEIWKAIEILKIY